MTISFKSHVSQYKKGFPTKGHEGKVMLTGRTASSASIFADARGETRCLTVDEFNQETQGLVKVNSSYGPNYYPSHRDHSPGTHSEHFY